MHQVPRTRLTAPAVADQLERGVRHQRAVPWWYHNGFPLGSVVVMPTNLTLKGVPDEVYERLKTSATVNHRSLNSEIIARLEAQVLPSRSATEQLAAIRAARARLTRDAFDHDVIDAAKREGRA